jgi:hypothetical protein
MNIEEKWKLLLARHNQAREALDECAANNRKGEKEAKAALYEANKAIREFTRLEQLAALPIDHQ